MVLFKPEDFADAGAGSSQFLKGLANTISNNVCSLYKNAPRGFVGALPAGNAVNAFNSGFWDDFCGRMPVPQVPPAPTPPFSGGQCPVTYNISGTCKAANTSTWGCQQSVSWSASLSGPIVGLVSSNGQVRVTNASGGSAAIVLQGASVQGAFEAESCSAAFVGYPLVIKGSVSISSVSRADGQPDSCGSLPAEYPNVYPPSSNPGTHTYTGNDGVERPINFSIDFDPTVNGPLVRLPDIPNVCVGFGFSGIEVDLCTNKPGEGTGGDIGAIDDKLDALGEKIDKISGDTDESLDKDPQEELPPEPTNPEEEPNDGFLSRCVPNLRFVKVSLTNIPPNANLEKGLGGFDRIDDAGWLSFVKDGFFFPAHRVEFGGAIFEAPPGVECFVLQLRFGFTAVVSTIVKDV